MAGAMTISRYRMPTARLNFQVYPALARHGVGSVAAWVAGARCGQQSGETCRDIPLVHDLGSVLNKTTLNTCGSHNSFCSV